MEKSLAVASCVLLVLVFVVEGKVRNEDSWVVETMQGPVRGYREPDGDTFAFYNIPYVTTPTGPNRFKAPLPPPTWSQPFEAVDMGVACPQNVVGANLGQNVVMQEDCLIANVYVPDTLERNLTVLVIVHGGAFHVGFGNWLKPKNLMRTKNIIVVNFNYRLGIHGFLCLGTKDAPGNAGMKDQVALLRWVKYNIASFGGNPDDVTLSGFSAGSISADLLLLSKSTRGLFNRLIPESGSHLATLAVQVDPLENAKYAARLFNFTDVDDINALEIFYKTAPFELLMSNLFIDQKDSTFVFSPCVERHLGEEVFLDDDPVNILKRGDYEKIPTLHGFADMEGLLRIDMFELWKTPMNEKFSDFLPVDLQFDSDEQKEQVAKTVKEYYFGEQPVSNDNVLAYVDYFSDIIVSIPTLRSIQSQIESGHTQIYLYEYSFVDENTPVVPHTNVTGATHSAQTMAIFDGSNMFVPDTPEYTQMRSTLRELWANFITVGEPVPSGSSLPVWPTVRENRTPHMSLGRVLELKGQLLEERYRFWYDIYSRYYRTAVPPPATDFASTMHTNIWLINVSMICAMFLLNCKI